MSHGRHGFPVPHVHRPHVHHSHHGLKHTVEHLVFAIFAGFLLFEMLVGSGAKPTPPPVPCQVSAGCR